MIVRDRAAFGVSCNTVTERWETREELLAAATKSGHRISASQLGRLHRAGLVPAPNVRALGRGRGTESRYPPGSAARLVRVMDVHAGEHRIAYVAWRLWWEEGGAIPESARRFLAQLARSFDHERERLGALLTGDTEGEPSAVAAMDKFYAEAESGRVSGVLGQARRNIGRERFATFLRVLAEVGTGHFTGYEEGDEEEEIEALVDRALGLDRARTDHLAHSDPWFGGSTGIDFAALSRILASRSMVALAQATDLELDQARVEVRSLIGVITTIAPMFDRLFGRSAFGFGIIARTFDAQTPRAQSFMLLGWLALRQDDALRAGLKRIALVAPQAEATLRLYGVFSQLREEIPALAPVLTDQRLATAQLDASAAETLNSEISRLRQSDPSSFDTFFAAHPEVTGWLTIVDQHHDDDSEHLENQIRTPSQATPPASGRSSDTDPVFEHASLRRVGDDED